MKACGNMKDIQENKVAAEWGSLFPRILPWFPRVKQGWPTAAGRVNPHPAVLVSRARGRRDHCSIGTLPRYTTNKPVRSYHRARDDKPFEVPDSLGCFQSDVLACLRKLPT